jgi:regulator of protease activity HflC (stomatin/prohibitin superfamily)
LSQFGEHKDRADARPFSSLPGKTFTASGLMLYAYVWLPFGLGASPYVSPQLQILAAALLIAGGGFLSADFAARARQRGPLPPRSVPRPDSETPSTRSHKLRALLSSAQEVLLSVDWRGDWLAIFSTLATSSIALLSMVKGWNAARYAGIESVVATAAGAMLVAAFAVVVLERHLVRLSEQVTPEASALARLCRVALLALLGLAASLGVRWLGYGEIATLLEHAVTLVSAAVALELIVRSLVYLFVPLPPLPLRRGQAQSVIAGLIRLRWPDVEHLSVTITRHFGIDLARSWALDFVRRRLLRLILGMALLSWLLTGVTVLGLYDRAVYEALGQPKAVFHSGLHVHLPWPFGLLRPIEFGLVREIPIVFASDNTLANDMPTTEQQPTLGGIEGAAPPASDRLWDSSHPSEASYLVASVSNGRQNFEVVNIDLRIMYRIGLSDTAARQAAYNIADPQAMIRAAAGRMLARYFARSTIWDVLGQNRAAFTRGFQEELQSKLASLDTGIEIMGVVVEAIHPPAAAASAYQGVQTAAIRSVVQIARAKADAVLTTNRAQQSATQSTDESLAVSVEQVEQARTALALFDGDRKAYREGGRSFLFERRLEHLDRALATVPYTIVDHRISKSAAPIIDLRPQGSGSVTQFQPETD